MNDPAGQHTIPEAALADFYDAANTCLGPANEMISDQPTAEVAAAFLYACARYNAFAMQDAGLKPEAVEEALVSTYRDCYAALLREDLGGNLIEINA